MKTIAIALALCAAACGELPIPGLPEGVVPPADLTPSACEDILADVVITKVTACDTAGLAHCDAVELGSSDTTEGEVAGCTADGRLCVYECP